MSKRVFDIILAGVGLLITWPFFVLLSGLIKLDSRGPVFFKQERIGKDGRPFHILKFRTMVENAYRIGPRLTQKRDPRVTRIGQVLRWLKLDELPQLWNVLKGEMSFVGPRPEDPHFVQFYSPEQHGVLAVRPGIVGPSQILGRDELERYPEGTVNTEQYYIEHILPEKLAVDLAYVNSYGLWGDLKLLVAGLGVTLFGAFKLKFLRLNRERIWLLGLDTLLSLLVYHVVYGMNFNWSYTPKGMSYLAFMTVLILVLRPPLYIYFGLYQNMLRYLGVTEFLNIFKAVSVGSVGVIALTFMFGFRDHSRLIFLISWGLLVMVLFGVRVALKTWFEYRRRAPVQEKKHALIVGANDTGAHLINAMANHDHMPYHPVGFLDDSPAKHGIAIHGIRVLGSVRDLPQIAAYMPVDVVLVLLPHIRPDSLRELIAYCQNNQLDYRLLPTLDQLLMGGVAIQEFGVPELDGVLGEMLGVYETSDTLETNGTAKPLPLPVKSRERQERRVLVTGGAGFIGSHVVRKLLARGCRVRVVDNYLYGDHGLQELLGHPRLEVIEGDIRHLGTMALATKGIDSVIALAALVGDAACDLDVDETLSINMESTRLLAEACLRSRVQRLVFASSCSVYGANSELVLNEGSWLNPVSLYAQTRIQSEKELLRHTDDLSVVILRLATVFGLSRRMRFDLVVNTFAAHGFFNGKIQVFGGKQWRPNLHVQDAAEAFILASQAEDRKVRGEIFNVGNNALNYPIAELARLVQVVLPKVKVEISPEVTDQRDYRVSFDKIRNVLGFHTQFTVMAGLREIISAFEDGEIITPHAEQYHNYRYLKTYGFQGAAAAQSTTREAPASL